MATGTSESAGGMPQLDLATFPNQIFWLVVTLLVIYFILNRIAIPRIAAVLTERQGSIQRDLDKAEQLKQQAEDAEVAYNQALADARAQAQEIVAETKAEIQKDLDAALAKADAEIAAKAAESDKAIKVIRDGAKKSVQEVANATAADIVKAVMPGVADAKSIKAAVTARLKG